MSMNLSAGVYPREVDQSYRVATTATSIGAIVISSNKGPANKVTLVTTNKEFISIFGKPTATTPSKHCALAFLEHGNQLKVVRAIVDAVAAKVDIMDGEGVAVKTYTVSAANPGSWGNSLTVSFTAPGTDGTFTVTVKNSGVQVEKFVVSRTVNSLDGYGRTLYIEDVINNQSQYITVEDNTANTNPHVAVTDTPLTAGADDTTALTDSQINTAWDLFAVKEEVEVSILINAGWATSAVQTKMANLAENRADCIAVLDIPPNKTAVSDMVDYVNDGSQLEVDSSYAAIYAPWLLIYDQYNDKQIYIPPSGHVAGIYAETDADAETWYAPAGVRRGRLNILGVQKAFSEGDRDSLYTGRINPIQVFPGEGIQVYGQKTLQSAASALDRVNVRRLMISIEKSVARALRPYVFEFNDNFTRSDVTAILNNYLGDIQSRRGTTGFAVVCDESNNTPTVIDNNQMIVDIYVKPSRAAEFIQVNAIITPTGTTITSSPTNQ